MCTERKHKPLSAAVWISPISTVQHSFAEEEIQTLTTAFPQRIRWKRRCVNEIPFYAIPSSEKWDYHYFFHPSTTVHELHAKENNRGKASSKFTQKKKFPSSRKLFLFIQTFAASCQQFLICVDNLSATRTNAQWRFTVRGVSEQHKIIYARISVAAYHFPSPNSPRQPFWGNFTSSRAFAMMCGVTKSVATTLY